MKKSLLLLIWITVSMAMEPLEPIDRNSVLMKVPRRGSIPGLGPLRPLLTALGALQLPFTFLNNLIPRLTQLIQSIPRPGSSGGGGLFGLANRPFGNRPNRPLANLLSGGSSSGGTAAGSSPGQGVSSSGTFFFRRSTELGANQPTGILDKMKNAYQRYQLDNPDCQRLVMCEFYRQSVSVKMGNMADKLLGILGTDSRLERSTYASGTKSTLKELLKAARSGLTHKDCSGLYFQCPRGIRDKARHLANQASVDYANAVNY